MSCGTTKTNDILCYLFTATTGHLQAYRRINWNMGKGVEEGSPQLNTSHLGAEERNWRERDRKGAHYKETDIAK
jgi:hypothetical protein